MKKYFIIAAAVLAVFLASCSGSGNSGPEDPNDPHNPGNSDKTIVVFDNTQGVCTASVYEDYRRRDEDKITEIPAGQISAEFEWTPGDSVPFYFSYSVNLSGISGFSISYVPEEMGKDQKIVRIDTNKKTNITIPTLEETVSSSDALLSNSSYILIQNNSSFSFELHRGTSAVRPDNLSSSPLINSGERAQYTVNPAGASAYQLYVSPNYRDFSAILENFEAGCVYSFTFNGSSLVLLAEIKLTLAQVFALSPPGNMIARSLPSGSINLGWDQVGTEDSYKIYRAEETPDNFIFLAATENTSYTDNTVILGKTYYYKLSSVKGSLESEKSADYATALSELTALAAPTGLNASVVGSDSIHLSWNAVADATTYRINRGFDAENIDTHVVSTASTSYTVSGLSANTGYYFTVSTISDFAESLPSEPVYATTSQAIQPPGGLNASALGTNSIQVTWNNVSGATGYRIYRSNSAYGTYSFIGTAYSSPYTDTGLSPGSTWYYKVSSVRDSQESAQSSSYVSATTQSGGGTIEYPPTMPTGLVVSSVSPGSITLSWNSVSTANSYNVYRSNTQTGAEAKLNTVSTTSYTDNVPAGASYYYKVTGVNGSGESPKSAGAFGFAESHYTLSYYSSAQTLSLVASGKHYYRLAVTQGSSYTIEWQNGSNQNTANYLRVYAYQNNGTSIFSDARYGYTEPRIFTATATGFVTIEVQNRESSVQNYQIYYY